MSSPNGTYGFKAIGVHQKGFTLFLTSLPASKLVRLCAGIRLSATQEPETVEPQYDSLEDAKKLIAALEAPRFAKDVIAAQRESYDRDDPYQRILDEARARDIAAYLREEDAMMPNGIILATRDDVEATVKAKGEITEVAIEWNSEEEQQPLNIIDGQHRVEALRILARDYPKEFAAFEVPVTLLLDQPFYVQAELFAVVNGRQKPVSRSRIYDLLGYLPMGDSETRKKAYLGEMAVHRFCHHAVKVLNRAEKSPWKDRIKMRGTGPGVVTQAALVDHLALYLKPRKERPSSQVLPVLYPFYHDSDLVGLVKLLIIYFVGIQKAWPSLWKSDEALKQCLFGKTNGVAVMLAVLHNLIVLAGGTQHLSLEFITGNWKNVPEALVMRPPKGGSKGYQAEVTQEVMRQMLGDNYSQGLAKAAMPLRETLRKSGALIH